MDTAKPASTSSQITEPPERRCRVRTVAFLSCFLVLACIQLLQLAQNRVSYTIPALILLAIAQFVTVLRSPSAGMGLLGFSLCVFPVFGRGSVDLVALSWLAAVELSPERKARRLEPPKQLSLLGIALIVSAAIAATVNTLFQDFDPLLFNNYLLNGRVIQLARLVDATPQSWFSAVTYLCGLITCLLLMRGVFLQSSSAELRQRFLTNLVFGVSIGSLVAVFYGVLQLGDIWIFSSINLSPFWSQIHRYNATFSDPNALGVFAALVVPVMLSTRRAIPVTAALALVAFAPWSGSRTFWFGISTCLFILWVIALRDHWGELRRRRYLVAVPLLAMAVLVVVGHPNVNERLRAVAPGQGLTRVLKSIHWSAAGQMFFSRQLYGEFAVRSWLTAPLLGVGLERFQTTHQAIASSYGVQLGEWRDNANNLYLQLLSEQGILGCAVFLFGLYLIAKAVTASSFGESCSMYSTTTTTTAKAVAISLVVFLVISLTGPHLLFGEVRYLLVLFIAVLSGERCSVAKLGVLKRCSVGITLFLPVYALLHCGIIQSTPGVSRGFYPPENLPNVGTIRWSGPEAKLKICGQGERVEFRLLHPAEYFPVKVRIIRINKNLVTTGPSHNEVAIFDQAVGDADWHQLVVEGASKETPVTLSISIDRPWTPYTGLAGSDPRLLGAMFRWLPDYC